MRYHNLLFSAAMAAANVARLKNQTRRIVKNSDFLINPEHPNHPFTGEHFGTDTPCDDSARYQVGDIIRQKETTFHVAPHRHIPRFAAVTADYIYRADYAYRDKDRGVIGPRHWKPSIFMPLEAVRFTATITQVRIQRLQDITEEDAIAEGVDPVVAASDPPPPWQSTAPAHIRLVNDRDHITAYRRLWNSINLKPSPVYRREPGGKKVIDHYISAPWSLEDFDAAYYHGSHQSGTFNNKPLRLFANPWVWCITYQPTTA